MHVCYSRARKGKARGNRTKPCSLLAGLEGGWAWAFFMGLSRIIILALTCRGGNSDRFNQTYYHLLFSLKRNKHKYITTGRQDICQARAPRVACCVRVCVECGLFFFFLQIQDGINTVTRPLLIIGGGAILRQIGVGYD